MKLDQEKLAWVVIGIIIGIMIGAGGVALSNRTRPAPIVIVPPAPTPAPQPTATPAAIRVYVNGQVVIPAVYELAPGSLVQQAVTAAGGFTADANTAVVNLAQSLVDGAHIYVPALGESVAQPVTVVTVQNVTSGNGVTADTVTNADGLININTADQTDLETLPGVGPSTAQNIITYREEHGPFSKIEDIMEVPGIGEGKFNQMKELITVEGG